MKTNFYPPRFAALLIIMLISSLGQINAQVATCNTATTIANIGIDSDVDANTSDANTDDWFLNGSFSGTGIGIIGTTAATAQPPLKISSADYATMLQSSGTVAGRNISYVQRMSVPYLTVHSNMLLLDAFAARDNVSSGGADSTVFSGASAKNEDNPSIWTIGSGSVPSKNDIVDVGGHLRRNLSTNDLWGFAFLSILANAGGEYSDVEFYRTIPSISGSSLINTGPAASGGHTPFLFSNTGAIIEPGDVLASVNYSLSSGLASIRVWVKPGNLNGLNQDTAWFNAQPGRPFTFTGDFISGTNSNGYGYAEITSRTTGSCIIYSTLNASTTPAGTWGHLSGSSLTYVNTLNTSQLVEIAINFTQLGLDLHNISGDCYNIFGSVLFKTRTSNSWSSELKDFAGPFTFGNFAEVQANAGIDRTLNCINPQITLLGATATPNATISWTTIDGNIVSGANTTQPTVDQTGTYILTVTNPTLATCVARDTVIVNSNFAMPTAFAGNDISIDCNTGPVVSVNATAGPNTTISWSALSGGNIVSGNTSVTPTVNSAAGYVMTVINNINGCEMKDTVYVSLHMAPPSSSPATITQPGCEGGCDGSIITSISSAYSPISYSWSNGATTSSITGLCAGTYTVTATGTNGCTISVSHTLSAPSALSGNLTPVAVLCKGDNTGSISFSANGGTTPYTYLWSNGATTQNLQNAGAGNYTVTVTDANNCSWTGSASVTEPAAPLSLTTTPTNILCRTDLSGSIQTQVNGGTSPYTYIWNNGATTSNISNIAAGNYTVTATDAHDCKVTVVTTLIQPSAILSGTLTTIAVSCNGGNNGSVTSNITGGTAPYQYNWSNGSATASISGVTAGTYTVTVTDAHGCTIIRTATVTQPAAPLNATSTQTNVLCFGNSTGAINITVTGGTTPYTYLWSNNATSQDLNNIPAGAYQVTITDNRGCTFYSSAIITQPAGPLTTSISNTAVKCNGGSDGSCSITATGGTSPYVYLWSNGGTGNSINNVAAGTYTVTVTDANGCTSVKSTTVSQPSSPLSLSETHTNLSCFSQPHGSIDLTATGGTAPYSYNWSNGFIQQDLTGLAANNYSVIVTDANGCTETLNVSITQPAGELHVSTTVDHVNCYSENNGSITLNLTQGTPPYNIMWSTGATSNSIANLTSGLYTASVSDANGCNLEITSYIQQPAVTLTSTDSIHPVYCFGEATGSVTLTAAGGTLPYTYNWSTGATTSEITGLTSGTYTVTVTDDQGCTETTTHTVTEPAAALNISASIAQPHCVNIYDGTIDATITGGTAPYTILWSNGAITEDINQLAPGNYTVLVTDAVNCTVLQSYTIDYTAPLLTAGAVSTAVLCHGDSTGSMDLTVNGGTTPYTFAWSNGATTEDITNVVTGNYSVTITDINGCTASYTNLIAEPAAALSVSGQNSNVNCFGDATAAIQLTVTDGTPGYTFLWSDGNTNEDRSNLSQGTYVVTVTDANACTVNVTFTITQPAAALNAQGTPTDVLCSGNNTGSVILTTSGGTTPYIYAWSNGATTANIQNITAGQYQVLVTDTNNCTYQASFTIAEPSAPITFSSTLEQVSCTGINNGKIELSVNGGTPAYSFLWNTGAITEDINGLPAGNYTVTISDANGCSENGSFTLQEPLESLDVNGTVTDATCIFGILGNIVIYPSGGTSPYNFIWSNSSQAQNLNNVLPGSYMVTITDVNGCTTSKEFTIADRSTLNVLSAGNATICVGNTVTIEAQSSQPIIAALQWYYNGSPLNGAHSTSFITPAPGTYTLVASTACGTYTSNPVEVVVRSMNSLSVSSDVIVCPGESIQLQASGGEEYVWSPSEGLNDIHSSTPVASPRVTTEYTVTVKDNFGCTARGTVVINVMCDTLDIPNGYSPNGDGTNDTFVIEGLSKYPVNTLWIYNRWGNLVYKVNNYDNTWDGRSNVKGVVLGEELPNGTYYYLLDLKLDQKPFKGFVVIRR